MVSTSLCTVSVSLPLHTGHMGTPTFSKVLTVSGGCDPRAIQAHGLSCSLSCGMHTSAPADHVAIRGSQLRLLCNIQAASSGWEPSWEATPGVLSTQVLGLLLGVTGWRREGKNSMGREKLSSVQCEQRPPLTLGGGLNPSDWPQVEFREQWPHHPLS